MATASNRMGMDSGMCVRMGQKVLQSFQDWAFCARLEPMYFVLWGNHREASVFGGGRGIFYFIFIF